MSKRKTFIVAGELSGDRIGAWYLKRHPDMQAEAVAGPFLLQAGAKQFDTIDNLSIVGITEIVRRLPFIFSYLKKLTKHILESNFDEVVLVDFPGFNLMLARRLKKARPSLRITYVSPPQLWVWGAWRVRKIRKYIDDVVVLYPFEVEWYAQRGVTARWEGYPFYEMVTQHRVGLEQKEKRVALLPGSRGSEIVRFIPLYAEVARQLVQTHPDVRFVLPVASSFTRERIQQLCQDAGLFDLGVPVDLVEGETQKFDALARCALAISKPGTVTLELALLQVPTIVIYRTSWLTYFLGYPFVRVAYMGLPNLFLGKEVFPELMQGDCTAPNIAKTAAELLSGYSENGANYRAIMGDLTKIDQLLFK